MHEAQMKAGFAEMNEGLDRGERKRGGSPVAKARALPVS